MSERKSWDIQPKRRAVAPVARPIERPVQRPTPRPAQRPPARAKERPMPEPQAQAIRKKPAVPQGRDREPLRARRKRARRRALVSICILSVVIIVAAFGSLWLGVVRVQGVEAQGPDADGMKSIATSVLAGNYHYVIPRNSIFFFPQQEIRTEILKQYPEISAVSISRTSLSTISITSIPREAALTWCGDIYTSAIVPTNASSTSAVPSCYSADAQGVIFASISDPNSVSNLHIYGPLTGDSDTNASPLGAVIAQANLIPNALQFIKALKSLGVPIVSFAIRGDEADLYAQSGTRITYVLGHEEVTAQVAESAFPALNLDDGSLEYVDLRFEGKAYFKKVGTEQVNTATSTVSNH